VNSQLHYEALRTPRPEPRYVEGWPPPRQKAPPGGRVRRITAVGLVRVARRLDAHATSRAVAP
jgi:hypothetical protein